MKMILFLGSGVSTASKLPTVPEIWERIRDSTEQPRVLQLLEKLDELDSAYLKNSAPYESRGTYQYTGQIYRTGTTYEDLFFLASQIVLNGSGLLADATADAFANLVRREGKLFLEGATDLAQTVDLYKLARQACQFIEKMVAELLFCTSPVGFDLVPSLARLHSVERLNIVTLNHDTLVEQVLIANRIPFTDGFGDPDGDLRWYEDRFDDSSKVSLIKPHGSINWYGIGDFKIVQSVGIMDRNVADWKDSQGFHPRYINSTPSLLTGASKVSSYNRGIFSDMHYRLQRALRESTVIVMSGYGWGDDPLNFHIGYWLDRNRANTLILLHTKPDDLVDRSKELMSMYRSYVENKRIIPIKKWLSDTSLSDIESYFQ